MSSSHFEQMLKEETDTTSISTITATRFNIPSKASRNDFGCNYSTLQSRFDDAPFIESTNSYSSYAVAQEHFSEEPNSQHNSETILEEHLITESGNDVVVGYLQQIIDMLHNTNSRLSKIEKRIAHQAVQIDFILDSLKGNATQNIYTPVTTFKIEPVKDTDMLTKLEDMLLDESYKSDLMRWLRINVSGDSADNRMLATMDLLLEKSFQAKCTWTGASRKGPKAAIMQQKNILRVFQEIGTSETEIITQSKLASFFMKKLKNSSKRLQTSGLRRGSRHVVRKHGIHDVAKPDATADSVEEKFISEDHKSIIEEMYDHDGHLDDK